MRSAHLPTSLVVIVAALALVLLAAATPAAFGKTYGDVSKSHWAYGYIKSVTNRSCNGHRLLDDFGSSFKPEKAITRELLARSLVLASGHYGEKITPVEIKDVPKGYRYYSVIQMAVHLGYMAVNKDGYFKPTGTVPAAKAESAIVRWLKEKYSSATWGLLGSLLPSKWEPNTDWKTGAPSYLPYVVASRQLQLRFNHSPGGDGHEVTPAQPIDRGEVAYMFWRAYKVGGEWVLSGLTSYKNVAFPVLSDRQKEIAKYALKYVGYPYIWGGEYPTKSSPYGSQKAGGFDCSGFVFYVMKMHFGYPLTVDERGASDQAKKAKPRIKRADLQCGDLIFFGPDGAKSAAGDIYHAALYLGNGWFIHSTGSSDGVTLASLDASSYWDDAFAWGRRLLTASELPASAARAAASSTVSVAPDPGQSAVPEDATSPSPSVGP